MSEAQGARGLQVHVTDVEDGIWYSDETSEQRCELSCQDFVKQDFVAQAETVQVLGTPSNAELILALYELSDQNLDSPTIYIGGANQIGPSLVGLGPQAILYSMRGCSWPPSLGGWHRATSIDNDVYKLVDFANRVPPNDWIDAGAVRLLKQHPAYVALSFLPSFDVWSAVKLLTSIIDPRWRINARHKGKPSMLLEFLGLLPRHAATERIRCYIEDPAVFAKRYRDGDRLVAAVETWLVGKQLSEWAPSAADEFDPGDYFFRHACLAKGSEAARVAVATAKFVTFIADVWLDNLTPARKYRHIKAALGKSKVKVPRKKLLKSPQYNPTLFVPEHFFSEDQNTAESFAKHLCHARAK